MKIADKYKWNLADLYPSEAAWRAAKEQLAAEIPTLDRFRGKLTASATTLADALDRLYALDKELSRLAVYAGSLADQDTRDQSHQGMQQEIVQLAATFGAVLFSVLVQRTLKGAAFLRDMRSIMAQAEQQARDNPPQADADPSRRVG